MRIAIFSECYTPVMNGVVTSLLSLREALRAEGHTIFVFAPGAAQPDDDAMVIRLPELPFPRHPYHFARPFPRFHFDFAALNIDLIHCQHPFTVGRLGAATARKYGLPMVYTVHSLYDSMATAAKSKLVRRVGPAYARGVMRRFCSRADYVIVPSRQTLVELRADGVNARFVLVPSGVRAPEVSATGRTRVRSLLGLTDVTPLLLYLGRLGPEKRVDLLLRAVRLLQERRLPPPAGDFRLALVGDGQCREDWELLAEELEVRERVLFPGPQPHAQTGDWYAAADLFTMPSPAETQGLALIEAMGAGLPCVAVAQGGPLDLMKPGVNGLLTPFDPAAFADAIQSLLLDPALRRTLGQAGRRHASEYAPEQMAHGVLAVYEQALQKEGIRH